jgi:hypothetical protein
MDTSVSELCLDPTAALEAVLDTLTFPGHLGNEGHF